jgi:diketogulonate reductase-like aldo/keto reductase
METRRFGWTGVQVPLIGQGTWKMEGDSPAEALAALQAGLDAGMTHVDTAELYGGGKVESLVGRAIAGRRDDVFLVSKVMPSHASRNGTVQACEASLRRLGTDHLDCYLLHWPGQHPLQDTIAAFEQLVQDGKIRSWGVSNFDVDDLEEALAIAGPRRIACNQVLYHLRARDIEAGVIPWCVEHEVAVVGYSPFGSGDFPQPQSKGGKVLGEIARKHGVTAHQVALAFLVRDPHVFGIPKSAKVARVQENAGAGRLRLSREEIAQIDQTFPVRRGRGLPTL